MLPIEVLLMESREKIGTSTDEDDWNGYSNQKTIEKYASDNTEGYGIKDFPAAYYCSVYGTEQSFNKSFIAFAAPAKSSGWFLPSCGQLKGIGSLYDGGDILIQKQIDKLNSYNDPNHPHTFIWMMRKGWQYCSSTEYGNDISNQAVVLRMYKSDNGQYSNLVEYVDKDSQGVQARAILAY